ncbi:phage tail assembly protein, partial [Edwardsiella tarda]
MKEIKLNKAIRAHGEDIHVLEMREPTGKDVRELGFP